MKSQITKLYLLAFMLMISLTSNAQSDPPGEDDVPVNNYILVLGIVGIFLAFTFINKKINSIKES